MLQKNLQNNPTFTNANGVFDFEKMQEYVANLKETDPLRYKNWLNFENSTAEQAVQNVYFDMVKAGVGVTVKEGELEYRLENDKINIQYVQLPYSKILDSAVSVSKSEIQDYINGHKDEFKRDAYAAIEYVKIDEKATLQDEQAITKEVTNLLNDRVEYNNVSKSTDTIPGLKKTKNIDEFLNENSALKYTNKYEFKGAVPVQVANTIFDGEIGDTFGPFNCLLYTSPSPRDRG